MNILTLLAGTIVIITFSWFFSIKYKRYHGIARFFSFESIFILLLMNYKVWFLKAFSFHQIVSWLFLVSSIYPGIAGYLLLKMKGSSQKSFENTTRLVKTGLYKYIRHPLYCSLFLFGTGVMFKNPGTWQVVLGVINLAAILFTALTEEKEMISRFGDDYLSYMRETKMFIPFII